MIRNHYTKREVTVVMIFDTQATQATQASLDALWLRTQVIADNLANADTPNYKEKDVSFEQILSGRYKARPEAEQNGRGAGTDGTPVYRTMIAEESGTDVRVDGNNVQLEQQQTALWKTYAQYSYLLQRFQGYYGTINSTISTMKR